MRCVIGIDVGGTAIKGVVIDEEGTILLNHQIPTYDEMDGWQNNVADMYHYLVTNTKIGIDSVGIACPGLPDENNTCICYMPGRLSGLERLDWSKFLGQKTYVLNDADAALVAEAKFGKLKGIKNGIILTLGTGVGGGILINGELYQGKFQRAGSFGHVCINNGSDEVGITGLPGTIEFAIGNYSIQKRSMGIFKDSKEVIDGYKNGDTFATWVWLESVRNLSLTLSSLINILSPDKIVLAGGLTLAGKDLMDPLQSFLSLYEFDVQNEPTPIEISGFDDYSGAVGAAAFALDKTNKYLKECH